MKAVREANGFEAKLIAGQELLGDISFIGMVGYKVAVEEGLIKAMFRTFYAIDQFNDVVVIDKSLIEFREGVRDAAKEMARYLEDCYHVEYMEHYDMEMALRFFVEPDPMCLKFRFMYLSYRLIEHMMENSEGQRMLESVEQELEWEVENSGRNTLPTLSHFELNKVMSMIHYEIEEPMINDEISILTDNGMDYEEGI